MWTWSHEHCSDSNEWVRKGGGGGCTCTFCEDNFKQRLESEDVLTGPHFVNGLFEGEDLVWDEGNGYGYGYGLACSCDGSGYDQGLGDVLGQWVSSLR